MTLLPPTPGQLLSIQRELNPDPESVAQDISHLKIWLQKQPHLPDIEDDQVLHTFLQGCQYSLQRTKHVLLHFFILRSYVTEFYLNRDPTSSTVRLNATAVYVCQLPSLTADGLHVYMIKFAFPENPASADIATMMRRLFMMFDVSLKEGAKKLGYVYVIDLAGFGLRHLKAYTPSLAKKISVCVQDALPSREFHGHLLNSPPFANKLLAIFKPYLTADIFNQVVVHESGYDEFYKYVPRDMLPAEYGGKAGTHKELSDAWQTKLESYKDWFLKEEEERQREMKRMNPEVRDMVGMTLGMEGPFTILGFD